MKTIWEIKPEKRDVEGKILYCLFSNGDEIAKFREVRIALSYLSMLAMERDKEKQ